MPKKDLGRVHVYTGLGKGKTTSALGLAMRAIGHGYKVTVVRFMSDHKEPGEWRLQRKLAPQLEILNFGETKTKNISSYEPTAMDVYMAQQGLSYVRRLLSGSKRPDVLILDEVNPAIYAGMLRAEDIVDVVRNAPKTTELVLTGRYAHADVVAEADVVTEMKELKHNGGSPRKGVEF